MPVQTREASVDTLAIANSPEEVASLEEEEDRQRDAYRLAASRGLDVIDYVQG